MAGATGVATQIIFTVLIWGGAMIFTTGLVLALWLWIRHIRRFKYHVVIFEKDGFGQIQRTSDKAGIFVDGRTNNKRLFLWRNKTGLDADKVPFVPDAKGKKTLYLAKFGLKNFRYLHFNVVDEKFDITVGEEDVNWGINAYERQKKALSANKFLQYAPWIGLAFVGIIFLIFMVYVIQKFDIFEEMARLMSEAAPVMRDTAQALQAAKTGTVVIS